MLMAWLLGLTVAAAVALYFRWEMRHAPVVETDFPPPPPSAADRMVPAAGDGRPAPAAVTVTGEAVQ